MVMSRGAPSGTWQGRELIVLMGAPGSGKSTYAMRFPRWVTTDAIRALKASGEVSRETVDEVYNGAFETVVAALRMNQPIVLDTPATSAVLRGRALKVAMTYHAAARLVVFTTDVETCVARQAGRTHPVPEDVVRRMHAAVVAEQAAIRSEGWTAIEYVDAINA